MKNKNNITSIPKVIKGVSFFDMIKEATEKAKVADDNYKKTGLCQGKVKVSDDVWEPCKRQSDPTNPRHFCKECQAHTDDLIRQLHESQGPGDFLIKL